MAFDAFYLSNIIIITSKYKIAYFSAETPPLVLPQRLQTLTPLLLQLVAEFYLP